MYFFMSHETRNNKTDGQATATIQCFIQPRRDGGVPRCVKAVLIWFTNCISWLAAARLQFPSLNFYDPKASPVPIHAGCNTDTALGWSDGVKVAKTFLHDPADGRQQCENEASFCLWLRFRERERGRTIRLKHFDFENSKNKSKHIPLKC